MKAEPEKIPLLLFASMLRENINIWLNLDPI